MSRPASALAWSPGAAGPLLAEEGRWWRRAACLGMDPELFFAETGRAPRRVAEAKTACASCPVVAQCLADAARTGDTDAIRGGMTWPERRDLLPPPEPWCRPARHPRTPQNTTADGSCRPCKRERQARDRKAERVKRTGSTSPQSGRRLAA